jgi:hypothetical protein
MELSILELNELVYSLSRVIEQDKKDPNVYNADIRRALYDKLYTELEHRCRWTMNIADINEV